MNQSNLQTAEEILNANKPYGRNWSEFLLPDQMEFLYRAMESYASQSLPQQPESAGIRWVKASERLPNEQTSYHLKVYGKPGFGKWYSDEKHFGVEATNGFGTFDETHFSEIFWLDDNN